ncbi:MAG: ATP synthase F1 subunit gamma [Dehalococcoidia bacterium]|jgi:F-type H+-transporting ATPase subunit gamma|nr:ATP synthase F1 subunit gamma [Dehalococcoidia bacterium]MDW8009139.1 ATP synthase F1 subunit gamma [Chloroflexota bacterium]
MPSLRQIRRRIRSVQNIAKVTRAMELVAASKMRRAQAAALAARPYAERMRWVLADLAETAHLLEPEQLHPLLRRRPEVRTVEVIFITPDRGLCGGLPANLNRRAAQFLLELGRPARIIAVGRKGRDFMLRSGQNVVAEFIGLGDRPGYDDILPIARIAMDDYVSEAADEVYLLYARFVSTSVQRPEVFKLLPVEPPTEAVTWRYDYIYEPDRESVLAELLPRYVERQIYEAVLEAVASEQSARMVAMRNATDNANGLIRDLTLLLNKVRQEVITKELLEITAGVEALKAATA